MSARPDEARIGSSQGQTVGEEGGGGGGVGDGVGRAIGGPAVGDPAPGGPAPGGPPAPMGPAPGGPAPEGGQLFVTKKPHQVLKKTPTSIVWNFFSFRQYKNKEVDETHVFCQLCEGEKQDTGMPYTSSTTNMTGHLKKEHAKEFKAFEEEKNRKSGSNIKNYFSSEKPVNKWSKSSEKWKNLTMSIAKWFVKDSRPALMVEDEGFIRFMEQAQPQFIMPCRITITNYIEKLYVEVKEKVKDELKQIEFVAKSTDGGSSSNASSFQETGVHGITNDFQMKYFTLAVKECKDEHTAENYRKNTDKVEEEFEVKEKVVMTTTDNEAKMRKAYKDHERTGCMSHFIHSSVNVGSTKEEVVNKIILKHRKIAAKHNKSYVAPY